MLGCIMACSTRHHAYSSVERGNFHEFGKDCMRTGEQKHALLFVLADDTQGLLAAFIRLRPLLLQLTLFDLRDPDASHLERVWKEVEGYISKTLVGDISNGMERGGNILQRAER